MKINRFAVVFVSVMMAASLFAGPRGHHHHGPRHSGRHHHSRHHSNAGIALAAGVIGLIAGAVIASEPTPSPQPVYVQQPEVVVQPQPVYVQQPKVVVKPQTVIVSEPKIVMPQTPNSVIVIP